MEKNWRKGSIARKKMEYKFIIKKSKKIKDEFLRVNNDKLPKILKKLSRNKKEIFYI